MCFMHRDVQPVCRVSEAENAFVLARSSVPCVPTHACVSYDQRDHNKLATMCRSTEAHWLNRNRYDHLDHLKASAMTQC